MTGEGATPGRSLRLRWVALALTLLILAVMGKACSYGFVDYDDHALINNPHMAATTWSEIPGFWGKPYQGQTYYKPMSHTLWAALALVSANFPTGRPGELLNPHIFHAANIVLHVIAALVVFLILVRLVRDRWAALMGAALFAVHPLQVEAVVWASGMPCSVSGLFMLVALWLYTLYATQPMGQGGRERAAGRRTAALYYTLATLAFLAAIFSKPTATVLPVLGGIIGYWLLRRPLWQVVKEMAPWLLMALPLMILTKSLEPDTMLGFVTPLWQRPLIMGDALSFYIYKLFIPANLGIDYGRTPQHVLQQGWVYVTGLAPLGLALLLLFKYSKGWLWAALGIFVVALAPVLGLVPFGHQEISTVADRYLYPSMLGPALAAAWVFARHRRRRAVMVTSVLVLALLCCLSLFQTHNWRHSSSLLNHTLSVNPNSSLGHVNLGAMLARRGEDAEAIQHLSRAIEISPRDVKAHYNLGLLFSRQGKVPRAIRSYQAALRIRPSKFSANRNLALLLLQQGQTDLAITHFERALAVRPGDPVTHNNLGNALIQARDYPSAARHFHQALALRPGYARAHYGLGLTAERQGQTEAAAGHYREALRHDPGHARARKALERLQGR